MALSSGYSSGVDAGGSGEHVVALRRELVVALGDDADDDAVAGAHLLDVREHLVARAVVERDGDHGHRAGR